MREGTETTGTGGEVPLVGGTANRGQVVRVGDTVRRPRRDTSAATHALLRHLADVGFAGAPRVLGVDGRGREVLSFVPGTAVTPPYPAWALTDDALVSVARLLRDYHRAVSSFDPEGHEWPPRPPAPFAGRLVTHNDVNLDNVVFRGGRAVALIDFDLASPGSRVWDVAGAARLWAPLRPDRHVGDSRRGRGLSRFRLFVDSYGLTDGDRDRLVSAVLGSHDWSYDVVGTAAANGHPAFTDYWTNGAMVRARETRQWYLDHADLLRDALA
ncbi:Phosphotransferase enzyme family protein [Geodermatophilus saharensis]|uniref:Phosphotransferase enzyme family protein n=1 Tax=Geodermatophilus saharensis TaxID=1137994 RepID=A0A239HQ70_9ACTN|nr:phosphotransferase [Geodermatophilus saharensis]SNS83361.1 Phosphotransferase enzyme family protein [Geodermatophilus saharensis]